MQPRSFADAVDGVVHIHVSSEADDLKSQLLEAECPLDVTRETMTRIASILVNDLDCDGLAPVLVLRGGLFLLQPLRERTSDATIGVLVPARTRHDLPPDVVYASLPRSDSGQYLLIDMLIASGRTMLACAHEISRHIPGAGFAFAAPFVAREGLSTLRTEFPESELHCIWHDERTDADGRMIGPGFDVGDLALGRPGELQTWRSS